MSFQVFFHNCTAELQHEVNSAIADFQQEGYELKVKSSGSTGVPKEILHPKEKIIASAKRTNTFFGLDEKSLVLCPLAIHTIGAKMALFRAISGDYEIHFVNASRDFLKEIPEDLKFDLVSLAVLQFSYLVEQHPDELGRFRSILLGGSAIPQDLEQQSIALGLSAYIGFGMTETLSHIALRKSGNDYYSCLDGITVESTETGMKIHQNNETITSTDLIQTIDNKTFKWIGRNDFVINSGGVKIIPELLENSISVRFNLKVIIVGIPDVTFGEKAILVSETPLDDALKMKLKGHIETEFGKYYVPKDFIQLSFEYINELKLDRRRLTAKVKAHYE